MTKNELKATLRIYASLSTVIDSLEYYLRNDYIRDTTALDSARNAQNILNKELLKKK